MTDLLPFAKPKDREGRVTISPRARRELLDYFCLIQKGRCCSCGVLMTREQGLMNTAELDHKVPQPAGCSKDDRKSNLQAMCFKCNRLKGSRR